MTSLVEDHVKIDVALAHLVNRLLDAYTGRCSREQVEEAVGAARMALAPVNVDVFVPVLVERAARDRLDVQLADGSVK
jgi:hypothetical protein